VLSTVTLVRSTTDALRLVDDCGDSYLDTPTGDDIIAGAVLSSAAARWIARYAAGAIGTLNGPLRVVA
jgi:hypothetical protein